MIHIHDKEVNTIAEWNLLHDIINTPIQSKNINSHYYPILHGCINTRKGRAKFKNFRIILDSECSSTSVIGRLVEKLHPENMPWCSGTRRPEISLLILRLKYILPYLDLVRRMLWHGNIMLMTLLSVDIIWYLDDIYQHD